MSTATAPAASTPTAESSAPPGWAVTHAWQLGALVVGFAVCVAILPVKIHTAFGGLPAHPLIIHVPVILDPVLAVASLALVARPRWRERYALAWAGFAIVCLAGTVLAVGAGEAFVEGRSRLSPTVADHKEAGENLRLIMFGLTAVVIALVAVDWARLRRVGPSLLAAPATAILLSVLVAAGAVGGGFFTVRTGHLGAKAVWERPG